MVEPLFGTVSPVWSAVPFPGLAWFQTPMGGTRPVGGPQGPAAVTSGMMSSAGSSNVVSTPMTTPFPSVLSQETAGVTAPALVMAVAIRRGQPGGPTSDQDIEDFIYDALDLLPGASDVEIRCDGGRTTLSGTVSQKRLKRDVGEIAWAIPAINDVNNNITIAPRRRSRAQSRDTEPAAVAGRKPA
jgi:BON domain